MQIDGGWIPGAVPFWMEGKVAEIKTHPVARPLVVRVWPNRLVMVDGGVEIAPASVMEWRLYRPTPAPAPPGFCCGPLRD